MASRPFASAAMVGCVLLLGACATIPPYAEPASGPLAQIRYKVVEPIGGAAIRSREGCEAETYIGDLRSVPVFYKGDRGGVVDPAFAQRTLKVRARAEHSFTVSMDLWGNGNARCTLFGSFWPDEGATYEVDLTFSWEKRGCGARLFRVSEDGQRQSKSLAREPSCPAGKK